MAADPVQWSRCLTYNDTVCYRAAVPAPHERSACRQSVEQGPYVGKIVDFQSWGVGVRADGWYGSAPLYYVLYADILGLVAQ